MGPMMLLAEDHQARLAAVVLLPLVEKAGAAAAAQVAASQAGDYTAPDVVAVAGSQVPKRHHMALDSGLYRAHTGPVQGAVAAHAEVGDDRTDSVAASALA